MTAGPATECRACGGTLGEVFYETGGVPVHSCLLLDTAEDALRFPKGPVRLAACGTCGTITNIDFDGKWSAYAPGYEDQQKFSPTFESFAGRLAQDLVARHDLKGCDVIDVGCSKGDFLTLMVRAGARRGIGIDPSAVPERLGPTEAANLDLHQELYNADHTNIPADLISCRHTLEHIHDVRGFLGLLHRHAATSRAPVFIEVPCMRRVLEDAAFEDIYYEHCSYFTPGALARSLRMAGFGVTRLWRDYDSQYLLAEAVADPSKDRHFDIEEPVEDTLALISRFAARVPETLARWRDVLRDAQQNRQRVAIWGSGSKCISVIHALDHPQAVSMIVDINPYRQGKFAPGMRLEISDPNDLKRDPADIIWVMNPIYVDEIARLCDGMNLTCRFVALGPNDALAPREGAT